MKRAFIDGPRSVWPVCAPRRVLGVSATGYPRRRRRRIGIGQRRFRSEEALLAHLVAAHAETRGACGGPRLWRGLGKGGARVDKQRVQRLMREHGVRVRGRRPFRMDRDVSPPGADRAWSDDAPYIDALEMPWRKRRPSKGELLLDRDRGGQYARRDFTRFLDAPGITASMRHKEN